MEERSEPLVTVVIPVYNHEKYILESIQSIIDQTYRKIELIVIDDGSRDKSHEIVSGILDACRQRFVQCEYIHRENRGLSATLNQALGLAQGKYFSALASDDVALPEKVQLLVEALESKGDRFAAAFGNALFIDDDGREVSLDTYGKRLAGSGDPIYSTFLDFHTRHLDWDYRSDPLGSYPALLAGNYLPAMSNIMRTASARANGGWTDGNLVEDWEMWLKLSKDYEFAFVDRPVALYRLHGLNSCSTITHGLLHASLVLVAKEREHCERNGLMSVWRQSHNMRLLEILRNKKVPLGNKVRGLKFVEPLPFLSFLAGRIAGKLARTLR